MKTALQHVLVLIAAAVGGAIGHFGMGWAYQQGFYAAILPGGLLGFGASLARNRSYVLAGLLGVAALGLGIFSEWTWRFWVDDPSFEYFINHLGDLTGVTKVMLVIGSLLGFYLPFRSAQVEKANARP